MGQSLGIYISVPFCKAKCTFCNFASDVFGAERLHSYVNRLAFEIEQARESATGCEALLPRSVDTVYFGGGTPSLLSAAQVSQIFASLRTQFDIQANAEITLECAPGQLSDETLHEFLRQGMNRVSLGVQSFVDRETAAVGRLHTQKVCEDEISRLRRAGIEDINIDLIAGLPHQTEKSWHYSLQQTIATGAPHVSVYMLEVDEESRLGREVLVKGQKYHASQVPDEDTVALWYEKACETLDRVGVPQYEISNFAREGHQSRHNLKYWRRHPYIGFGLDAHSMLLTGTGAVRFANTDGLDTYLAQPPRTNTSAVLRQIFTANQPEKQFLGPNEELEESFFLGLRLNEGISLTDLRERFGDSLIQTVMPSIQEACEGGLLLFEQGRIYLTPRGRMASNEVFARLLIPAAA
jgi:oxygen-independent coproporphyrinogen III oxidase